MPRQQIDEVTKMFEKISTERLRRILKLYLEENSGRPTRIGIFEPESGGLTDYWIESGLQLDVIEVSQGEKHTTLRVVAGQYSHQIVDPIRFSLHFTPAGTEDGVDISEASGRTFVLRFES